MRNIKIEIRKNYSGEELKDLLELIEGIVLNEETSDKMENGIAIYDYLLEVKATDKTLYIKESE